MFDRALRFAKGVAAAAARTVGAAPRTGAQVSNAGDGTFSVDAVPAGGSGFSAANASNIDLWAKCPAASLKTWRRMRRNPTIALALAAARAPVKAAPWNIDENPGAPKGAVDLIQKHIIPLRPDILGDGLCAVEFGWQPFEIVWDIVGGKQVIVQLKPLLQEMTKILTDPTTGAFMGLKNGDVTLSPEESFVVRFDGEAGNMEGKSRLENVRERAWWPWEQCMVKVSQYTTKAAGIIPIVHYPIGTSLGPTGQTFSNTTVAANLAGQLGRGGAVLMPNQISSQAEALLQRGADIQQLLAWRLEFVEAKGNHGSELIAMLDKMESLMVRGILQPERSLLEGNHGNKAEAQTHHDVGTSIAQDTSDQLMRIINKDLTDKVLVANYGPEAAGTVLIEAAPLVDEQAELLRQIIEQVLIAPSNVDLLLGVLDLEASMDQVGLPVRPHAPSQDQLAKLASAQPPQPPHDHTPDNPDAIVASIFKAARVLRSTG